MFHILVRFSNSSLSSEYALILVCDWTCIFLMTDRGAHFMVMNTADWKTPCQIFFLLARVPLISWYAF